ncbi:uncharacterized protein AKAME5_002219700 [Lates japonicus]|uniref:C2H2-type domain-containing protein n=1 Tax=Lates japonicus TaxID=270547 RepID=A0AAD3RIY4_LATJO|nr:uncharacterized protein AKAME5_002219700 [Lates japonicus]
MQQEVFRDFGGWSWCPSQLPLLFSSPPLSLVALDTLQASSPLHGSRKIEGPHKPLRSLGAASQPEEEEEEGEAEQSEMKARPPPSRSTCGCIAAAVPSAAATVAKCSSTARDCNPTRPPARCRAYPPTAWALLSVQPKEEPLEEERVEGGVIVGETDISKARPGKKARSLLARIQGDDAAATELVAGDESHFVKVVDGNVIYFCSVCVRSYMTLSSLKRHSNVHSWRRKYPCHYCGKVFAWLSTVTKHEGKRPYKTYSDGLHNGLLLPPTETPPLSLPGLGCSLGPGDLQSLIS